MRSPAFLLDLDADRFGAREGIAQLADRLQAPVAVLNTCKSMFDVTSPWFVGDYVGAGSAPEVRRAVEESDCLIAVGVRRIDSMSGLFSDKLPADTIHLRAFSADVDGANFQAIGLNEVLAALQVATLPCDDRAPPERSAAHRSKAAGKLSQEVFWPLMEDMLL